MLDSLGQAVEDSLGLSSPTRRRRRTSTRAARSYGRVRSRSTRSTSRSSRRGRPAQRRRY